MSQNDDNTLYNNILNQYAESKRIIQQAMDDHQLAHMGSDPFTITKYC